MKRWNNISAKWDRESALQWICVWCNAHLAAQVPNENTLVDVVNPTGMWKAVKNETEVKNERIAHLKDGIAITKMLLLAASYG